jgi:hypothetical protein
MNRFWTVKASAYCPKALMPYYVSFIPEEWRRPTEVRGGHAFISSVFPPQLFAESRSFVRKEIIDPRIILVLTY